MKPKFLLGLLALLCAQALRSQAQPFSMDGFVIAGGGGTSTGGVYTISATIGQHDTGSLSGGQFTLSGGFWAAIASQSSGVPTLLLFTAASSGQVMLTWNPDIPGFHLQVSPTLWPPAWTNAPSGTNHPISVPITGAAGFYRLVSP
jgi:hypothetical protein